jgi:hypothetical protein
MTARPFTTQPVGRSRPWQNRNPARHRIRPRTDLAPATPAALAEVVRSMILRSILIGGEPGGGKSNLLNLITAHAALHPSYRHPESG